MNERFFELKKVRQDRIINGAMQVFTENGYRHASTDEMVSAASISKGLLFHYFKSKKGTFRFLYEYSTRYSLIELREADRRRGCDYYEMYRLLTMADASVVKRYPWMPLFLKRADLELRGAADSGISFELLDIPEDLRGAAAAHRLSLVEGAVRPLFLSEENAANVSQLLDLAREGLLRELLSVSREQPSAPAGSDRLPDGPSSPGFPAKSNTSLLQKDGEPLPMHEEYASRFQAYLRTLRRMNL